MSRSISNLRLAIVLWFFLCASAQAQEAWMSAAAPTSRNLWGVAWGAGLFVAVGEGGTILTSSDGGGWTQCASGTTEWLVGATFANGRFVVVGDKGALLTSVDGLVWTARPSGTAERLNAVAFGNDLWLAVGENGAAVTSPDGVNWSLVPPDERTGWTSAFTGWLRGLCFAYGSFVSTGQRGRIVTTADAGSFQNYSVATMANIEGVVFARHRFVAVGDGGLVLTSIDAATWRGSLAPTALRAVAFFNNVFVAAAANGSILTSPDTANWTVRPTGSGSLLNALAASPSTIVAVGFGGAILRAAATQTPPVIATPPADLTEAAGNNVLLAVAATGTAPLTYQWRFEGQPIAGATNDTLPLLAVASAQVGRYTVTVTNALGSITSHAATLTVVPAFPEPSDVFDPTFISPFASSDRVTALLVQPDGKILVANAGTVSRLMPDGATDASFASQPAADGTTINTLALQSDGKILAGGTTGANAIHLVRLTAAGQLDATFAPPPTLPGQTIAHLVLQPDGKILVANATSRLVRLHADGSLDTAFAGADLSSFVNASGVPPIIKRIALAPDGRMVVAAAPASYTEGFFSFFVEVLVARFRGDGTPDPAFAPVRTGTLQPKLLSVLPDGRVLLASESTVGDFGRGQWKLQRLNADGTDDATFRTQVGSIAKYGGNMRAARDASGRIVVAVGWQNVMPGFKAMRFLPDGTVDTTLRYEEPRYGAFRSLINAVVALPDGRTLLSGQRGFARLVAANAPAVNPPVALSDLAPPAIAITGGGDVTLATRVAGTGTFTYGWDVFYSNHSRESAYSPQANDSLTLSNVRMGGSAIARITNAAGTLVYPTQLIRVPPSPPVLVRAPASLAIEAGRFVEISFDALGSGPLTYRWLFNGKEIRSGVSTPWISRANSDSGGSYSGMLPLYGVDATTVGTYQLVLSNPLGTATSATFTVSIDPSSRLANVAARGFAGTGDNALIAGFVVAGLTPKWVLIRGVGPGLAPFGVADFLADPKITLFDATGATLEENDNWVGTGESYTTLNWPAAFPLPVGSRDAIISRRLPPGSYTVQINGVGGATGTALAEIYEGIHDLPRLSNLSSRVLVRGGEQIAISGVVVTGQLPKKLLVRAAGPALSQFGVNGALADPRLTLVDRTGATVASNDDWSSGSNSAEVSSAAARVGAFPFANGSGDAALLATVAPGSYTALVSGANGTSGVVLVEIYEVP